jgi:hypothetical protein
MLRLNENIGKTCFDFVERKQLHCEAITRASERRGSVLKYVTEPRVKRNAEI